MSERPIDDAVFAAQQMRSQFLEKAVAELEEENSALRTIHNEIGEAFDRAWREAARPSERLINAEQERNDLRAQLAASEARAGKAADILREAMAYVPQGHPLWKHYTEFKADWKGSTDAHDC